MNIVFLGQNAANFWDGIEDLLDVPHTITLVSDGLATDAERAAFRNADVIVAIRFTAAMPRPDYLRLLQAPAAGTDQIELAALPAGAALCNAFGHEQPIAEYVMAALLARRVPVAAANAQLREGNWHFWAGRGGEPRDELGDGTIGLVGFGHIGQAIAVRAKAFGMRVAVCNRSPVERSDIVDASYGLGDLHDFLGVADAVVVSLPLLPETRGFLDAAAFAAMRPNAVVVNVGRGPVIDEQALYDALKSKRIAGAVIDTWYVYPSPDNPAPMPGHLPFHELDAVTMTPHMSGWTTGTVRRRRQTIADNINRLHRGEPLLNPVPR